MRCGTAHPSRPEGLLVTLQLPPRWLQPPHFARGRGHTYRRPVGSTGMALFRAASTPQVGSTLSRFSSWTAVTLMVTAAVEADSGGGLRGGGGPADAAPPWCAASSRASSSAARARIAADLPQSRAEPECS